MDRLLRATAGICLTLGLTFVVAAPAFASIGEIFQPSGIAGCLADTGVTPGCRDTRSAQGMSAVTVAPDGRHAWALGTAGSMGSVIVLDRSSKSGELKQKTGTAGCVSSDGSNGECVVGRALDEPTRLAVSPDGENLYVISETSTTIAIFDVLADGSLVQKPGTAGCVATSVVPSCAELPSLAEPTGVAVSPDGLSVYVSDSTLNGVFNFDRLGDGSIVKKEGTLGCASEDGSGGSCTDGRALEGASDLTVSPASDNLYVASSASDAVAVFDRAASGKLSQPAGTGGCVMVDGASSNCAVGRALAGALRLVVSADGENLYLSALLSDAISVFDRDRSDGSLTQKGGTAGCISKDGVGGECSIGRAIGFTFDLALTSDGRSLYAASRTGSLAGAVAVLQRSIDTGELEQSSGDDGCVSADGSNDCSVARAIDTPAGIAASPDGASVYTASFSDSALAIFERSPVGPAIAFDRVPRAKTSNRKAVFKYSSPTPGATFECRLDGKAFAVCPATKVYKRIPRGRHVFAVRAVKNLSPGKAVKYSWLVR